MNEKVSREILYWKEWLEMGFVPLSYKYWAEKIEPIF